MKISALGFERIVREDREAWDLVRGDWDHDFSFP
jgi:hypothetical protein